MMNIAVDALAMVGNMSKNRGIGNYNISQFKKMMEQDKVNKYFILNLYDDFDLKEQLQYGDNVKEFYFSCGLNNFLTKNREYHKVLGDIIKNFIKENEIDVFYITSPFDFTTMIYDNNWLEGVQTIATVYDIIPYIFKDIYLTEKSAERSYSESIDFLRSVDKIVVISKSVKDDLINYLGFNEEHIEVIYAGVEDCYKKLDVSEFQKHEILQKYEITNEKFVMCTGGGDPRKNIEQLIIAFSKMPKELINVYQLVIVCKLTKDEMNMYLDIAIQNGIKGRVVFTNYVSLSDLIILYNLATLLAFPSKYEGFGLPIVESMACGTPVLTSNNSSLGEIAGNAAILVDPYEIKDITSGLITALSKTDLDDLVKKGTERVKLFTWDNVAKNCLSIINKFNKLEKIEPKTEKQRIAFFTPLPPLQSGISDYSVDILNALSEYMDIDVFIDDEYIPKCTLSENIKIYNHEKYKAMKDEYSDTVYQVGNSGFHVYMFKYIRKYRGTVVLHDTNLHGVLQDFTMQNGDMAAYKKYLYEDYTANIVDSYVKDLRSNVTSLKIHDMMANGFIINYANKVIVHSEYSKRKLLEKNISRNVRTILLYAKINYLKDNYDSRNSKNITENEIILASFGHIHMTKRSMPALKAFCKLTKKYSNIKYYLVGKPDDTIKQELYEYIENNNLKEKVIVTGYTSLDEFENYIDIADICLNLRYPYNGETSASLMRILAKGKCVLVNDLGSFSEIPDECCIKIKSPKEMSEQDEINEIYAKLENAIENKDARDNCSKNAKAFAIEKLDINKIAKQYVDFINSKSTHALNEKNIYNIINEEIQNNSYSDNDILELSKTLAYSKYDI